MKLIENNEDFCIACDAINREKFISIDTEFVRESNSIPFLCLLQIATKDEIFIIDPTMVDISILKQPLENVEIKKIFHDARQDLEILNSFVINVTNVFDTQIANMLISTKESESYRILVRKYCGKQLKKALTLSDWTHRPLSKQQLKYATEDVKYLYEIYTKQMEKLVALDRVSWLDTAVVSDDDRVDEQEYRLLKEWVENRAKLENTTADQLIHKSLFLAVCKRGLYFVKKLQNARNINGNTIVSEFLEYASTIVKDSAKIDTNQTDVIYLLHTLLHVVARKNSVCPSIIARRQDLDLIANGEWEKSVCSSGWRFKLFGQHALKLMSGKINLSIQNNEVTIK